ncbi:MAG: uracil-DNA glycosylase [Bacteroides sp. SM23_62]|nr:MAG: uracil-DNA glycosylase [Bacteroides sp. SM23_62]
MQSSKSQEGKLLNPLKTKKQKALEDFNNRIRDCDRCRLSLTRKHILAGEGDMDARIMLIALSPGENEDAEDRMFIGPSGQVLDKLFHEAGMEREWIYMTNLIKCTLPKCRRPKMDEIESCSKFLEDEISIIQPEIIVPLGYYATRTILTKYHADPPAARKDFKKKYGILIFSDDQKILPLPHPATLLYDPSFEHETIEKYKKLPILMQACKWYSMCPMKRFYEAGRLERKWIELYCKGIWQNCVRYEMEELDHYHFDWMLPDGSPDENLKGY